MQLELGDELKIVACIQCWHNKISHSTKKLNFFHSSVQDKSLLHSMEYRWTLNRIFHDIILDVSVIIVNKLHLPQFNLPINQCLAH